jgi:beta-glucosidase
VNAGLDLEMPGDTIWRGSLIHKSLLAKKILPRTLNARAKAVLQCVQRAAAAHPEAMELDSEGSTDDPNSGQINREFAAESIVLLRNENKVLPLSECYEEIHQGRVRGTDTSTCRRL